MSDNESHLSDLFGEYSDWIELYNPGENTIQLSGYYLSDDPAYLKKWPIPDLSFDANEFRLIFASGRDIRSGAELHTNFRISSDGEILFLVNDLGEVMDHVSLPSSENNEVYHRFPDGSENWYKSDIPSPWNPNRMKNLLSFSMKPGFYTSSFYLNINSLLNDSIYYTLDGSIPDQNSFLWTDSFLIEKNNSPNKLSEVRTTPHSSKIDYPEWRSPRDNVSKGTIIRCISYRNGKANSEIFSASYFIENNDLKESELPVISLITDSLNLFDYDSGIYIPGKYYDPDNSQWTGNYFQRGREWERPVHIEYFDNLGNIVLSQNAGIRVHGFKTRQAAQKSLRIYARNDYGEKYFDYPLIAGSRTDRYKRFLLRSTMGCWDNTIIKDVLTATSTKNLEFETMNSQPCIVYINGEYWGIHTIRDYIDEHYFQIKYNIDKDSVDIINGNYTLVESGSNEKYIELVDFIKYNDLSIESNYEYIKTKINMNSFIDYMVAETFFANEDWIDNNQKMWRPQTLEGKWNWIFYDLDAGFSNLNKNMYHFVERVNQNQDLKSTDGVYFLFAALSKNAGFSRQYADRYAQILQNELSTKSLLTHLHSQKQRYEKAIPSHIKRWNYPESFTKWELNIQWALTEFIEKRHCIAMNQLKNFLEIEDIKYECPDPNTFKDSLIITPNPSDGHFYINNKFDQPLLGSIKIYDLSGKIFFQDNYYFIDSFDKNQVNFSHINTGIYILEFYNSEVFVRRKIIIVE
jgi:hypothetical protein